MMINNTGIFNLFGERQSERLSNFDITLLPMNLSEGRNIGNLEGLFLFTPPKKCEAGRQSDILIILFSCDNTYISAPELKIWSNIIAETYFSSRGSFTMGMNTAVKKLSAHLTKQYTNKIFPTITMNAAVLRDRTLMLAHAGPVHSTVIAYDHVQNFSDESCLPIQLNHNNLFFFTSEIHSEDIILLCPNVPNDWTNSAIMEVTSDSPLNAIRFLLDRSGGNLKAAVIQLKNGKGQISFRSKTTITTNVQQENTQDNLNSRVSYQKNSSDDSLIERKSSEAPLMRQRRAAELFEVNKPTSVITEDTSTAEFNTNNPPVEINENSPANKSFTGEQELPGSQSLPYDFSEDTAAITNKSTVKKKKRIVYQSARDKSGIQPKQPQKKEKFNFKRFVLIILCGLLVPILVVSVLFFTYSGRSKDQLHREYLTLAVSAAQKALNDPLPLNQESLWTEALNYAEQSLNYGNSPAASDLRKEAMNQIDRINGGISTVYSYANQTKLPQGINITEIASSGQYTYALDSTSGSVLRFSSSGTGFALDNNFSCTPGVYSEFGSENNSIQVGAFVDFTILPTGNPHSFVLAAIDADANLLYCSGFTRNQAARLKKPEAGRLTINNITFSNNALYVLDTQSSAVWEYLFNNSDGFIYEPSNYYGSYSPYLSDVIDFTMFKENSFFLRDDGTLLMCDYTGYRPACQSITEISNDNNTVHIGLSNHHFRKILVNNSPDNSIYIMDSKLQTILNLSVKANFIRYIVPNRSFDEISQFSDATAFGIADRNRLLWGYKNNLYAGNMP